MIVQRLFNPFWEALSTTQIPVRTLAASSTLNDNVLSNLPRPLGFGTEGFKRVLKKETKDVNTSGLVL